MLEVSAIRHIFQSVPTDMRILEKPIVGMYKKCLWMSLFSFVLGVSRPRHSTEIK